jgi:predicted murein hydrolase (TIGR00659 family)
MTAVPHQSLGEIWVYLSASPLLGLTLTLLAYQGAVWLNQRCKGHPLANPVLLAVIVLVTLLAFTGTSYQTYFDGAQFVHFLLGPATVALAIPLYAQLDRLKRMAGPLLVALLAGSLTAALSAVLIGKLLGASDATLISLAPKSVTTPIAMGIAERLGGLPSLTAVLVILTGILGAIGAQGLYALMRCRDPAVRGFALGVASHGIGTARAFQISEQTGAFAALAMGLNGLLTAALLPLLIPSLMQWLN